MTLKNFVRLFFRYKVVFATAFFCVFALGWVWYGLSSGYQATVSVNIARSHATYTTDEFRYDNFYRLQADERFADTVVRWLDSPNIVADITGKVSSYAKGDWYWGGAFEARRLSSQFIEVTFDAHDEDSAKALAYAMRDVLNDRAGSLNVDGDAQGWFVVLVDEPSLAPSGFSFWQTCALTIFSGLFVAFWSVLLRYFWEEEK